MLITHWTLETSMSKSSSMLGSATLIAVKSLAMTSTAMAIAPRATSVRRSSPAIRARR
jgi:hypothetical protein